jgi:hypothetical protein
MGMWAEVGQRMLNSYRRQGADEEDVDEEENL